MLTSLVLMPTAIMLAWQGIRASVHLAKGGVVTAAIGFVTGVILLLSNPLLSECVILTGYLVAALAVYGYGFAWGDAPKARLLNKHS